MLYNIDFTVAAIIILVALMGHFVSNYTHDSSQSPIFLVFITFMLILGIVDILNVVILSQPSASIQDCYFICTINVALSMLAPGVLFAFFEAPLGIIKSKAKMTVIMSIPSIACALLVMGINPSTHLFFSINESHYYTQGTWDSLFLVVLIFYVVSGIVLTINNHRQKDRYLVICTVLIVLIGTAYLVCSSLYPNHRILVFACALATLVLYLGFQIPEKHYDLLTSTLRMPAFEQEAAAALKANPQTTYVLLYSNISEFKAINGLYNSKKGDSILIGLAEQMRRCFGQRAIIGRVQSDHFVILVPKNDFVFSELITRFSDEYLGERFKCSVHVAFGIYLIDDRDVSVSTMCDRAHIALETIHDSKFQTYAIYNDGQEQAFLMDHEIAGSMQDSLKNGDFKVYIQPIIDLSTQKICGGEALIRWEHPQRGLLSPAVFVPMFERNGLISELDAYVRTTVCKCISRRIKEGRPVVPISMNISRVDINPALPASINRLKKTYDIPAELLRFEITETAYDDDQKSLHTFIEALHQCNFDIMLDDFGSGYSSLALLEDELFDFIKIDQNFISHINRNERSIAVLESTIELANRLGLPVVTEGIETPEQAELVKNLGSTYAQGYLYSKPQPMENIEAYLDGKCE